MDSSSLSVSVISVSVCGGVTVSISYIASFVWSTTILEKGKIYFAVVNHVVEYGHPSSQRNANDGSEEKPQPRSSYGETMGGAATGQIQNATGGTGQREGHASHGYDCQGIGKPSKEAWERNFGIISRLWLTTMMIWVTVTSSETQSQTGD